MKYPLEKLFLVCIGKHCSASDRGDDRGESIQQELKHHNKAMGRKHVARICQVSCLDLCDYGPNIVVHPEGTVYGHCTRKTARAIYDGEMGDGPARPDLELEI